MTRRERDERARDQEEQTRTEERVKIMTTHLLPLSVVPETLPVLFGPDGSAPDAPMWRPPLWDGQRWAWDYMIDDLPRLRRLSLRLDVESVAARVAGLCALALGGVADSARVRSAAGSFALFYDVADPKPGDEVALFCTLAGDAYPDTASFLAALFVSLAPRIAALGGSP